MKQQEINATFEKFKKLAKCGEKTERRYECHDGHWSNEYFDNENKWEYTIILPKADYKDTKELVKVTCAYLMRFDNKRTSDCRERTWLYICSQQCNGDENEWNYKNKFESLGEICTVKYNNACEHEGYIDYFPRNEKGKKIDNHAKHEVELKKIAGSFHEKIYKELMRYIDRTIEIEQEKQKEKKKISTTTQEFKRQNFLQKLLSKNALAKIKTTTNDFNK